MTVSAVSIPQISFRQRDSLSLLDIYLSHPKRRCLVNGNYIRLEDSQLVQTRANFESPHQHRSYSFVIGISNLPITSLRPLLCNHIPLRFRAPVRHAFLLTYEPVRQKNNSSSDQGNTNRPVQSKKMARSLNFGF